MIATHLAERTLNHLLTQNPAAAHALRRHRGQRVRIVLPTGPIDLAITEAGLFSEDAVGAPDATLKPTLALALRLPFSGREAFRLAESAGDGALLATLGRVFAELDWDIAADLAPWVGDAVAKRVADISHSARSGLHNAAHAAGINLAEYLTEEAQLLASRQEIARFCAEVDDVAEAVARLDARLGRLRPRPA